jgi:pilus assembly protein CpaC
MKPFALIPLAATALIALAPADAADARARRQPAPAPKPIAAAPATPVSVAAGIEAIDVLAGKSKLVAAPGQLERVAISNPKVADLKVVSGHQILLQGLQPGTTTLTVWTKAGQARSYDVTVGLDTAAVQRQLRALTGNGSLSVAHNGHAFLLSGEAEAIGQIALAEKIVGSYGAPVVNLVQLAARREQIQIDVHVVELSKSAMLNFGYTLGGGEVTDIQNGIRRYIFKPGSMAMGEATTGNPSTFGQIDFLAARLDVLQRKGDARLLAHPRLVTTDGGTAKFLAGGEIPIPISQALGQTTITWKEFGVRLEIQPTLGAGNRITLAVRPEVSSLDFVGGVKLNNFVVPALKSRRAETTVILGAEETLMLGGLVNTEHARNWDQLPFIGDIPILGELFKNRAFQDSQTELAILVTPRLVTPDAQTRLPGRLPQVNDELQREMEK